MRRRRQKAVWRGVPGVDRLVEFSASERDSGDGGGGLQRRLGAARRGLQRSVELLEVLARAAVVVFGDPCWRRFEVGGRLRLRSGGGGDAGGGGGGGREDDGGGEVGSSPPRAPALPPIPFFLFSFFPFFLPLLPLPFFFLPCTCVFIPSLAV